MKITKCCNKNDQRTLSVLKKNNKSQIFGCDFSELLISKCLEPKSLTPTIVNASNEVLVNLFLAKKIGFLDIVETINKIFKDKDFKKYAKRNPSSLNEIKMIDNWARLKTINMCVR